MATEALPASQPREPLPGGPFVVAGLGRAGQAAIAALADIAGTAAVRACDHSKASQTRRERRRLRRAGIETSLGTDPPVFDTIPRPRCLVKSPGIPLDAPLLVSARRHRVEVIDELELGWRLRSAPVIGVTGTNGKSTVAALVAATLEAAGLRAPLAGNADQGRPMSEVAREPSDWIVCEVSSFQLEACESVLPEIAVFTNLTPEHLGRHGGMRAYGEAKRRLFIRGRATAPLSVVDVDCDFGRRLAGAIEGLGGRVVRAGASRDADYRIERAEWDLRWATLTIRTPSAVVELQTRLPGRYNARNATLALAVAEAAGLDADSVAAALASCPPPPGRFEVVEEGQAFDVIVDYAHSPDGVEQFLGAVRAGMRRHGRLRAVLCAAGRADPPLRRAIGRVAGQLTDELAVTSLRLRGGGSLHALGYLLEGAASAAGANVAAMPDRRAAIERMVRSARPGDALVLVGRGAMAGHRVDGGGRTRPGLADADVVRELLGGS